jgi:cytochrome c oxidase cbb3-type subunit IV
MDMDLVRSFSTVLAMIAFIAVACWAWSRKRKSDFDAAARLPLLDDEQRKGH